MVGSASLPQPNLCSIKAASYTQREKEGSRRSGGRDNLGAERSSVTNYEGLKRLNCGH